MTSPRHNLELTYYGAGPDDPAMLNGIDVAFLTDDEQKILQRLRSQILAHTKSNQYKQDCYLGKQIVQHLDIAVPRNLTDIGTAVGWAGTTVDAIDERIDWLGWVTDDGNVNGLDEIFDDNNLAVESNYSQIDSLTTGTSFVSVGNEKFDILGNSLAEGDERQLVTVESSSTATVLWDYRKRRSIAGLSQTCDERGHVLMETLYLEMANITFARDPITNALEVVSRNQHDLGRCFMTRLPNRPRPFQLEGRSEISRAVRYYTAAAVRTMLGMEVNREFYTAPQRMILNAKPEDFGIKTAAMDEVAKFRAGLSIAMGMINIVPGREDNTEGDPVAVHEFKPQPPTPYIEQVKAYSIQMSAETGLPATLFGFVTDNPTSGDAIVKSEFRLTRRAARRISTFGMGWKEVGLLCLLARDGVDGVDLDFYRRLRCHYANPMLPTPAATADEIQKMVAAEVLVPDSGVTYELYGRLDERQQKQLEKDKTAFEAKQLRKAMQDAEIAAAANPTPPGGEPGVGGGGKPSTQKKPASE